MNHDNLLVRKDEIKVENEQMKQHLARKIKMDMVKENNELLELSRVQSNYLANMEKAEH